MKDKSKEILMKEHKDPLKLLFLQNIISKYLPHLFALTKEKISFNKIKNK